MEMLPEFKLMFFVLHDEGEEAVTEGWFYTLDELYDRLANIGSRWFFYPHTRILKGDEVLEEHICWECL